MVVVAIAVVVVVAVVVMAVVVVAAQTAGGTAAVAETHTTMIIPLIPKHQTSITPFNSLAQNPRK